MYERELIKMQVIKECITLNCNATIANILNNNYIVAIEDRIKVSSNIRLQLIILSLTSDME